MIHEANKTRWKIGSIVVHDVDAKTERMLMRVTGTTATGLYITRYIDQRVSKERYENELRYLHEPARFGIEVTNREIRKES